VGSIPTLDHLENRVAVQHRQVQRSAFPFEFLGKRKENVPQKTKKI
jgi:hypothetical protein